MHWTRIAPRWRLRHAPGLRRPRKTLHGPNLGDLALARSRVWDPAPQAACYSGMSPTRSRPGQRVSTVNSSLSRCRQLSVLFGEAEYQRRCGYRNSARRCLEGCYSRAGCRNRVQLTRRFRRGSARALSRIARTIHDNRAAQRFRNLDAHRARRHRHATRDRVRDHMPCGRRACSACSV